MDADRKNNRARVSPGYVELILKNAREMREGRLPPVPTELSVEEQASKLLLKAIPLVLTRLIVNRGLEGDLVPDRVCEPALALAIKKELEDLGLPHRLEFDDANQPCGVFLRNPEFVQRNPL
jgi:hypothetical protein